MPRQPIIRRPRPGAAPRAPRVFHAFLHHVTFIPVYIDVLRSVQVLLGDSAAKASADAGWVVVSRPKQKAFTAWEGHNPYTMTIKVMFDNVYEDQPVETEYNDLHRIMRSPVGPKKEPSPVRLIGALPLKELLWVVQEIDQDEGSIIRRQRDGQMIRCAATVTLLEYVEADVAISVRPSPARAAVERQAAAGDPPVQRNYTVKQGDTLSKIAASLLGSYRRYPEIASLNGIRDPNRISPGQVLKIP